MEQNTRNTKWRATKSFGYAALLLSATGVEIDLLEGSAHVLKQAAYAYLYILSIEDVQHRLKRSIIVLMASAILAIAPSVIEDSSDEPVTLEISEP